MKYTLRKATERPFLYSKNNIVTDVNKEFMKFTGYSEKELIGKSLIEIGDILRINSQVYLQNIENEYDCYVFTKEYEPREVTIFCKSLEYENERAHFIKEKTNSRIEDKLPYAATILSDNEIGVAIYNIRDGILLKTNNKFLDFLGVLDYERGNSIGRSPKEIFAAYKESDFENIFFNVVKTGKSYYSKEDKYGYFEKGDTRWDISLVPIYLSGKAKYIVYTASEISKRIVNSKLVEDALLTWDVSDKVKYKENLLIKAHLDLFNKMIENLQVGFVRCSYPEHKILDMNSKSYNHLKQLNPHIGPLSSIIGKSAFDLFNFNKDEEAKFKRSIQNIIDRKVNSNFDYRKIIIEGEERFFKLVHQPLFGLNDQIVEIIDIAIDITEEVKAKNEMKKAFKIQEELFANISHELKTPLNVIYSTNQLMELYLKNDWLGVDKKKVSNNINIIKQNCYRFTKLINNIVDLSKIESGFFKLNLSNQNIVQVTEDIVQSVSEYIKRKGISITFDTDTEEKIIACDPEKIERIILNLISNALKFTNSEGSIFVNILDKGDTVEIVVEDTGIGIEKKHLDNIFGRFHQVDKSLSRNAEGSGIGLSLVKSIIELHGGKISVESEVGKGSIFKVELPARTVENTKVIEETKPVSNKVQMINIEFSDIYSI